MAGLDPSVPGSQEDFWCKNRLQEYTQRTSIPLPVYQSMNEGAQHAPQFRACVWVDGLCFTSPYTFPNRKMAEKDAAKHALAGIMHKVKYESSAYIRTDTVFCKSIINEYAKKMNMGSPVYTTMETKAVVPIFVSTLSLNNAYYHGEPGKNKKEAEQSAARAAIISILESESGITLSEIVKSKFRFCDALKKLKDSSKVEGGNIPAAVHPLENAPINNKPEVCSGGAVAAPLENAPIYNKIAAPLENALIDNKQEGHGSGGAIAAPLENAPIYNKIAAPLENAPIYNKIAAPLENAPIYNKIAAPLENAPPIYNKIAAPLENAPIDNKQEGHGSGGAVAALLENAPIYNKIAAPLENAPIDNKQGHGCGGAVATPLENAPINDKQEVHGSGGAVATPLENAPSNDKQEVSGSECVVSTPLENAPINNKQEVFGSVGTVEAPPISLIPFPSIQLVQPQATGQQNPAAEAGLPPHPEVKRAEPETSPAAQLIVPGPTLQQHSSVQATHPPHHEFKRPETINLSTAIPLLPDFIPLVSQNPLTPTTSGKKRRRKAKKKQKDQSQLSVAATPQNATPACSVVQANPING